MGWYSKYKSDCRVRQARRDAISTTLHPTDKAVTDKINEIIKLIDTELEDN